MNNDLENYLNFGKLPPCSCCHKREGFKARMEINGEGDYYLEWLCEECLYRGIVHVTKKRKCANCEKLIDSSDYYSFEDTIFCSKDCAIEYNGYYKMNHWEKVADEFYKDFGKKIAIS